MSTFFHISIIWREQEKSVEVLSPIFNLAEDWLFLGSGNWIIYTTEDLLTWQGRMRAILGAMDTCFISEITDVHATGGWLQQSGWNWLRKNRMPIAQLMPPRWS